MADTVALATLAVAGATLLVAVVATVIAVRQLRDAAKASKVVALNMVLSPLLRPGVPEMRFQVLAGLVKPEEPQPGDEVLLRDLINAYNEVGLYVLEGKVDDASVRRLHGQDMVRVWKAVKPFVRHQRERKEARWGTALYAEYFEKTAAKWNDLLD